VRNGAEPQASLRHRAEALSSVWTVTVEVCRGSLC